MTYIIDFISIIIEFYTLKIFFRRYPLYDRLENKSIIYEISIMLIFCFFNYANNFQGNILSSTLFILLLSLEYSIIYYKRVLLIFLLFMLMGIIEIICTLFISILFHISVNQIIYNIVLYTAAVLLSKYICYVIIKIISTHIKEKELIYNKFKLIILLILTTTIVFTFYFVSRLAYQSNNQKIIILSFTIMIILMISCVTLFESYSWYSGMILSKNELELSTQQLEFQKTYNEHVVMNYDEIKKIKHDLKNQLTGILGILYSGDTNGAINHLAEISNIINDPCKEIMYTNNAYLNAILFSKKSVADSYGIDFNIEISFFSTGTIDEKDLGIIIGCALDNAIESSINYNNKNSKINLCITINREYLCIKISNPCKENKINFQSTTKKNNLSLHGFGVKNITHISAKNNGSATFVVENNLVTLNIILKLK